MKTEIPTVNDIKLPVRVHMSCIVDANGGYVTKCLDATDAVDIIVALNAYPTLLAERDALREALAELASFAKYVAGRGFVGNITREVAEKNLIYRVESAEAVLEQGKVRLALAKGGGE